MDLCNALDTLIAGEAKMIESGDDLGDDFTMFDHALSLILDSFKEKLIVDLYRDKLKADGTNDGALLRDAVSCMKAVEQENVTLSSLQSEMVNDLKQLRQEESDAKNWLSGYQWYDKVRDFFTGSDEAQDKRAIIQNSEDMIKVLVQIMTEIAPEIAQVENAVYDSASIALQKIIDKIEKLLQDPSISNNNKADQIKYLMGLALGILAMIQTDAATEKAKDQKSMSSSTIDASMSNFQNSKAELKQFEKALSYANAMANLMKIVKPVMEVGGCLLAPGVGSLLVMAAFAVMDNAGLTDKLTNRLAELGLGKIGAEALVGSLELVAVVGGGAILDKTATIAVKAAADAAMKQTASEMTFLINETVDKALSQANQVGNKVAEDSVRAVVTDAVASAARSAAEKTAELTSRQASATLVPQLIKAAYKEGSLRLSTVLAKTAEENCVIAVEAAAKAAAKDIGFLAEAAANGADITGSEISAVSVRAANDAAAGVSNSTAEKVADNTGVSATKKAVTRGAWVAGYNALNNGAFSYTMEAILKKAGVDGEALTITMDIIKALEQMMASSVVMAGAGVMSSAVMNGSSTTIISLGTAAQLIATGVQARALYGQADATMKQADEVAALSKISASNDMLQNLLKEFNQQKDIDQRHLAAQANEQASNFTLMSQLENNLNSLARALATEAV